MSYVKPGQIWELKNKKVGPTGISSIQILKINLEMDLFSYKWLNDEYVLKGSINKLLQNGVLNKNYLFFNQLKDLY